MIEKFGSEEAYKEYMRSIGKKGGGCSSGYKFGFGRVDPSEAGRAGAKKRWDKERKEEERDKELL